MATSLGPEHESDTNGASTPVTGSDENANTPTEVRSGAENMIKDRQQTLIKMQPELYRSARRRLGGPLPGGAGASDVLQETNLAVIDGVRAEKCPDDAARAQAWVWGIERNKICDAIKRAKRAGARIESGVVFIDGGRSPSSAAAGNEKAMHVRNVLSKLDNLDAEILLLKREHGLGRREIAEALGIPESTVRSQLKRAERQFKALYRQIYGKSSTCETQERST